MSITVAKIDTKSVNMTVEVRSNSLYSSADFDKTSKDMEEREYVENKYGNIVPYITKENACEIHQILNDSNVLDMFFGSEEPPYVKQNLLYTYSTFF
ncbi:unnamed protein product [Rhizophagus irregularis]|nr:unnamed protein product [Rhizophagus irregularis]